MRKSDVPRLERAFTAEPPRLDEAVERAFRRGAETAARRRRRRQALIAAAACAVILVALALAMGHMTRPRPDLVASPHGPTDAPYKREAGKPARHTPAPDVPTCTPAPTPAPVVPAAPVYFTEGGVYYHGLADCIGMRNARAHTLSEAEAAGKERCPYCQPGEPDHYDLFKAAFGQDLEALTPGWAYSYYSKGTGFLDDCTWNVTDGTDTRAACRAVSFLKADGGVTSVTLGGDALEDVICFRFDALEPGDEDVWRFLGETAIGARAHRELDGAVAQALDEAALEAPVGVQPYDIRVAVDARGRIVALEVNLLSPDRGALVNVCYTLNGEEYGRKAGVLPNAPDADGSSEPIAGSADSRDPTRRRYVCNDDGYYHADRACPMLAGRTVFAASRAEASGAGRAPCPMCQPDAPADMALFLRAFGREMFSALHPDSCYAFTRSDVNTGEYSWYMRSLEDEDAYSTLATFETRARESEPSLPGNFEAGGVRMKVCMDAAADDLALLREAPGPMGEMVARTEAAIAALPELGATKAESRPAWNLCIYVCFDAARERITAVDFAAEGPEAVCVRWQRNGDGGFDMAEMRVNGVARDPGV